ncbi:MAG TPA: calcium-binding protein, partial [Novosphingobium sp.]|nr:calcium-binding protein [Novosphingobium sp.]
MPVDDIVRFGGDITRDNIVFTRDGNDLVISIAERTDTLRIRNQFLTSDHGVERFEFFDGSFLSIADVEELLQIEGGNRGDNVIIGSLDNPNVLDGRQGNDTLIGGNQADTYAFGADYGFDRIVERPDAPGVIDRVQFGVSVTRDALRISRDGDDLVIDLGNGLDVLTIVGGLAGTRIEEFRFGDGSILTFEEIVDRMLTGGEGDDLLIGLDNRDDTLSGGAGSDARRGGLGNDTYRFGYGDGFDSIEDAGGIDTLAFGPGVTRDMVAFDTLDGDLLVTLSATGERIAIIGGYRASPVELFTFVDGETLTIAQVRADLLRSGAGGGQNVIDSRDFDADFILTGGPGHDRFILGQGGTVVFTRGNGIDRVEMAPGTTTALVVVADRASVDAKVRQATAAGDDLIISFESGGDEIRIVGALGSGALPSILFGDAVIWDAAALVQASISAQTSAGNDVVRGSDRADVLAGGRGDDLLIGGRGDDIYRFVRGDGQDVIEDEQGSDRLELIGYVPADVRVERLSADRNDLILTFADSADSIIIRNAAIDIVAFGNGVEWSRDTLLDLVNAIGTAGDDRLTGTTGSEIYRPGPGNDIIIDGRGADIIEFRRGDGQDRIEGTGNVDGLTEIRFDSSIALEDVSARRDSQGNIVLLIAGGSDRITLVDPVADADPVVSTLRFSDGRTVQVAALAAAIPATDGDDHVIVPATSGVNLFGRDGNDWLESGRGNDVLDGDRGNDLLQGHSGADTYVFARGDGQDTIADIEAVASGVVDRIRFGPGIAPADLRIVSVGPADLVIAIAGGNDRITIRDMFVQQGINSRIELFEFANGATWTLAEIVAFAATGSQGDDIIDFGSAPGIDATIAGGRGDDTVSGGPGDTTYLFNPGDGRDTIIEPNVAGSLDTLRFGAGIDPAQTVAVRQGNDLLLRFVGSEDQVLIRNQFAWTNKPVDTFVFAGGITLDAAAMAAIVVSEAEAQRLLHPGIDDNNPFGDPLFALGGTGGSGDGSGGGSGGGSGSGSGGAGLPVTLSATPGVVDTFAFFVPLVDDGTALTTITGFAPGDLGDRLDIRLAEGLVGQVVARQSGADSYIVFVDQGVHDLDAARLLIRLPGVATAALSGGNFSGAPFATDLPRTITGTAAAETLDGGWGRDTITGLAGNDRLDG